MDSERRGDEIPKSLLTDLFQRGGDALYGALRRGVGDASEGLDEFRDNLRKMVTPKDGEHIHLGDGSSCKTLELKPGPHTLRLLFAKGDHVPYDPAVTASVDIVVDP